MLQKRSFLKLITIFMMVNQLLFAQKITQIKFEGLGYLSPSVAKEIANIPLDKEMNPTKIDNSIKNFYLQGYFKDVWVEEDSGVLTYHFKEKMSVANIKIEGYGSGDDSKELLKNIGLKKGDLYDKRRIKKAKKALIKDIERKGYYDTVVEVSSTRVGKNGVALVFEVNKGEKITINRVNFIGAKKLSKEEIEKDLANKEEDFLGWMPWRNNGEASIEQLEYDGFRAKNAYMEHGYLDAKVSDPLMRVDFGSYKAQIDYKVKEGKQYRVDVVEISHTLKELKEGDLKSLLRLKKGKIFNVKHMRKDMETIKEEVGNFGYAFVKVAPQMHQNEDVHTVNVQYVISQGEKVTINDVIISGNSSTKDRVIRRYIYLVPGDIFNARDLKDSKGALGRTGFFEKVDVQSERVSANKINLLVKVKETATGSISLGGGYSSFQGVMLNTNYSEKNTFGSGISTNIGFEVSKISKNYNLSFSNPKVWDSKYSLGMSFYKRNYEYYNFTQDQLGGSINLGREFWRYFHASVGVGYVDNQSERNEDNIIGADGNISFVDSFGLYNDKYSKSSLFSSFSFDNTDDFYVPRNGMLSALNFEYASLKGNDFNASIGSGEENGYGDYFKISGKYGIYYGVEDWIDYDLIFRFKARGTFIFNGENEKLPIGEKLFMGGAGSIRGFDPYSISPTAGTDTNTFGLGGKKRTSFSLEASIPLSESAKMRLTGFYDYAMIGEESLTEVKRSSTGVVIEWQSAFGPINLIFAKALNEKPLDRTAIFEFSMGSKF